MAANPPLCAAAGSGHLFPLPYHGETIYMSRPGTELQLKGSGLLTRGHKWSARGTAFLTSMRLVFVPDRPDTSSGLQAFELPLAYITEEDFNQPILWANNLAGRCFMVEGGPAGSQPLQWTLYLREGGAGTFVPWFFRSCAYVRSLASRQQQQQAQVQTAGYPPPATGSSMDAAPAPPPQLLQTALVDPSDPTKVYLTAPLEPSQQREDAPKFPAPLV